MAEIEFWYEFGSTYSYPAAMRIERLAADAGVALRWRPFLLGPIFKAYGWNDSPFNIFAAKGRYMWRDLERICAADRPGARPAPGSFPAKRAQGRAARADRRAPKAGRRPSPAPCSPRITPSRRTSATTRRLRAILSALGVDADAAFAAANTPENKEALKRQTEEAASRGLFGAPSFTVGDELFWGNDRLEAALAWAQRGLGRQAPTGRWRAA